MSSRLGNGSNAFTSSGSAPEVGDKLHRDSDVWEVVAVEAHSNGKAVVTLAPEVEPSGPMPTHAQRSQRHAELTKQSEVLRYVSAGLRAHSAALRSNGAPNE